MAISTNAELLTALDNWTKRTLGSRGQECISLCESRLNRLLSGMQTEVDSSTLTGTLGSRLVSISGLTRFVAPIALFLTTNSYERKVLRPFVPGTETQSTTNGTPSAWAINGTNIELDVPCDSAHTFILRYWQGLAVAGGANWVITNHPDVYLFGSLVEATSLFKDLDEMRPLWEQRFMQAVEEVKEKEARSKAIAPLTVDSALVGGRAYFDYTTGL
jgi:hypothetical protein